MELNNNDDKAEQFMEAAEESSDSEGDATFVPGYGRQQERLNNMRQSMCEQLGSHGI